VLQASGTKLQQEDAHVAPKLALPDRRGLQEFLWPPFPVGNPADKDLL
jgi:hypothetical protein